VGEAIVETTLDFEQILGLLEELDVALGEGFESFLVGRGGGRTSEGGGNPADGGPGAEESSERGGRAHIWWFEGEKKVQVLRVGCVRPLAQTRNGSDACSHPSST